MNKSQEPKNLERGITLISLVMTILIMVILAALILRAVTGDEPLIGVTTEATENYKIEEYREDLMREVMGVIQGCMVKGEDVALDKIAKAIRRDLDWVVQVKVNQDETITNPDIIVTSKEGYVFQVIYDDIYGTFKVDYIGKNPGEDDIDEILKYIPRVTGRYDKVNTQIIGEASVDKGSIKSLEIIFQGETLVPNTGSNTEKVVKTIDEAGIYQIKATTDRGISRSAYVRVNSLSGNLEPPEIRETNGIHGIEGWYRDGLEVTISSIDESVTEIYYLLRDSKNIEEGNLSKDEITGDIMNEEGWEKAEGNSAVLPISKLGRTRITAYVSDGKNKSEVNSITVKFDNVKPSMTLSDPGTGWYKEDINITVNGEDANSGINGYKYYINDEEKGTHETDITKPIVVSTEGTTKVRANTVDKAGNESASQERTVKLDKTGPVIDTPLEKKKIGATSFTVVAHATDEVAGRDTSGLDKYKCIVTENSIGKEVKTVESNNGEFTVTGLKNLTRYDLKIVGIDNAGNESEVPCIDYVRTVGELKAPNLDIEPLVAGGKGNDIYYTCGVKITVTDSADANVTSADKFYYEIVDKYNEARVIKDKTEIISYTNFNTDGNFKIRAWAEDSEKTEGPKTEWKTFCIDTAAPTIPTIILAANSVATNSKQWRNTTIVATITPGTDLVSGVKGIQYYLEADASGGQNDKGSIESKYNEVLTSGFNSNNGSSLNINITVDRKNKNTCKNSR